MSVVLHIIYWLFRQTSCRVYISENTNKTSSTCSIHSISSTLHIKPSLTNMLRPSSHLNFIQDQIFIYPTIPIAKSFTQVIKSTPDVLPYNFILFIDYSVIFQGLMIHVHSVTADPRLRFFFFFFFLNKNLFVKYYQFEN